MKASTRLHRSTVSSMQSGEIFVYSFTGTGRDLIIKLFDIEDGQSLYGILTSPSFSAPLIWYAGHITGACLTFGVNWFLDPAIGPETHPGSSYQRDPHHRLFLDKDDQFVLRFLPNANGAPRPIDWAVGDSKDRQLDSTAAPVAAFRLWADEADYLNPRARPIFEYPITA